MAFDITNTNRSSSIIRVIDAGTTNVFLANLSSGANETITAANIRKVAWSTNGSITITRNSVPILALHNAGVIQFDELNHAIANNNNQTMVITIVTGGSLVMEVTKEATYTVGSSGY
jgi:hypothetical protein